jgi:alanine racemase
LRRAGISLPILVLNPEEVTFDVLVQYHLEPELYSFGILTAFQQYLQQSGLNNYPVHIKLDTGCIAWVLKQKILLHWVNY